MSKKPIKPQVYLGAAALSYLITYALFTCFRIGVFSSEAVFLPVMLAFFWLAVKAYGIRNRNTVIGAMVFSALFSLGVVLGRKIIQGESGAYFSDFIWTDPIYWIIITLCGYLVFSNLIWFILNHQARWTGEREFLTPKRTALCFALIFICQLPYWVTFYPGNLTYDSFFVLRQALGLQGYSNHHPFFFTLFLQTIVGLGLKATGELDKAIGIYLLVQMAVFSGALTYALTWLVKRGVPRPVFYMVFLFFALNPVLGIYGVTLWKDIFFGAWVLIFVLLIYDVVDSGGDMLKSRKGAVLFTVFSFLVAFGRNNGIYILAAAFLVLGIWLRSMWKRLVPLFLSILICTAVIQGPVYTALGVKESDFAESIGIPLQQLVYSLKNGAQLTNEQEEILSGMMDLEAVQEVYDPYTVDPVKGHASFDNDYLNENKGPVLKVWLQLLPSNFVSYVKAWLMQTKGFWNWGTENWVIRGLIDENELGISEQNILGIDLRTLVNNGFNFFRTSPVIRNLYSISATFWAVLLYAVVMLVQGRGKYVLPLVPLIALWGTNMIATPVFCEFRYVFALHLAWPFIIVTMGYSGRAKLKAR